MNEQLFIEELKKININVSQEQLDKLNEYYDLLIDWNDKINLTRITKKEDVFLKHFYDSLTLAKYTDLTKDICLCDVGTGAGFPGIVLKIFFPNLKITLIDSLNKRITFLNEVIDKLELRNIEAKHYRMEDYSIENEEKFDIITSRAVARLEILSEICSKALKVNGIMAFMKGQCEEEIKSSLEILEKLNLKINKINNFVLPIENSNRTILIINKNQKTPKKYPRSIDKIKKSL